MGANPLVRLPPRRDPAATNMAIDSALPALARASSGGVLRFYRWAGDALTFGYAQPHAEVRNYAKTIGFPLQTGVLVRRPSGGGIVDHRNDVTYAFAISSALSSSRLPPARFYCVLHEALSEALEACACSTTLAPCGDRTAARGRHLPAACFTDGPVPSDVIHRRSGAKIAGAALRRSPDGVLAQGSLDRRQLPPDLTVDRLESAFAAALCPAFGCFRSDRRVDWPETFPNPADCQRFASSTWNERR